MIGSLGIRFLTSSGCCGPWWVVVTPRNSRHSSVLRSRKVCIVQWMTTAGVPLRVAATALSMNARSVIWE